MNMRTRTSLGIATLLALAGAASGQVVISQVYGGGGNTGAPSAIMKHDFVEIYNAGASPVNIGGWSLQYNSATGTGAWQVSVIPANTQISAGGYITIRQAAGTGALPDTVADIIPATTFNMSASAGKVALVNNSTALPNGGCPVGNAALVDFVGFGTANCWEGTATAPATNNNTSLQRTAGNIDTNDNSVDFVTLTPPSPRTGGASNPTPSADLVLGAISDSPDPLVGFPGNIVFSVAGVTNVGLNNAAGVTLQTNLPAGVSFVSSTIPGGSVNAGVLTLPLGTINTGGPGTGAFTVTLSATQAFPAEQLLPLTWTVAYGNDATPADNVVKTRTEVLPTGGIIAGGVQKDDIAWGWNSVSATNTLKLVRNAINGTPALVRNTWRQFGFIEFAEFDNAGGILRNPAGNLLGVNFGVAATGGLVHLYSTSDLTAATGVTIGTFTDATTFTSGSATSFIGRTRLSGISVNPANTRVAMTGDDTGTLIVFDYNPAGPDYLTNGREIPAISNVASTCGTAWLDNDTVMIASAGTGTDMRFRLVDDDGVSLSVMSSNLLSAPGGGNMFTDVEYLPGVSPLVIVSAGRFNANVTNNTIYVFDTAVAGWELSAPAQFDYSSSLQTMRSVSYASNGTLVIGQFGGSTTVPANTPSIDRIVNATTVGAFANNNSVDYFAVTNLSDPDINLSVSFNGLCVAAGVGGGTAGCSLADITEVGGTEEFPGNPDGQLTVDDLILFVNLFSAGTGCPGIGPCNRADVTGIGGNGAAPDGELTVDDLIEFVNAFISGC